MPGAASGSSSGSSSASGAPACTGTSSARRTDTRMPLSSISTSPMPLSWTICTSSRMRSARDWSTPLAIVSSRLCRPRMFWSSSSASSPKSAIRTSSSSLAARPSRLLADVLGRGRVVGRVDVVADEGDGARDGRVDRARRHAVPALDQRPELVDHRAVAAGRENVDQRLRREDLPDRRGERRPAGLAADLLELVEHLVQAVAGAVRAHLRVERGHEARRQVVLGRANREPRRERRDGLVADVLVDDVRGLPEPVGVDAGRETDAVERRCQGLARDAVER